MCVLPAINKWFSLLIGQNDVVRYGSCTDLSSWSRRLTSSSSLWARWPPSLWIFSNASLISTRQRTWANHNVRCCLLYRLIPELTWANLNVGCCLLYRLIPELTWANLNVGCCSLYRVKRERTWANHNVRCCLLYRVKREQTWANHNVGY